MSWPTSPTASSWKLISLSLRWRPGVLELLDQRLLPQREEWLRMESLTDMVEAIGSLKVRGAPLIGVAAALALAEEARRLGQNEMGDISLSQAVEQLEQTRQQLAASRPTAVNLAWALERLAQNCLRNATELDSLASLTSCLEGEAQKIFNEDVELCERIAQNGAELIQDGDQILTHCNTGGLATAGVGTALGILRRAHEQGKKIHVFVDETRPLLQGGRLTTWELKRLGIPFTLICDSMAATLMAQGRVSKVLVGADRIARNGDFANKVGTYNLAVLSFYHRVPFLMAAPWSTVDSHCLSGGQIPVEERGAEEVWGISGAQDSPVYNPAFDITPHEFVESWILDRGVYSQEQVKAGAFAPR